LNNRIELHSERAMEALIVALFALAVTVLLEAGYWIALALTRWSPVLVAGVFVCWLANRHGFANLEAIGLGVLACLLVRHLVLRRDRYGDFI
jgi:hypothetical protein